MPGVVAGGVFFFNDTATTEIYTLSLHDALPICIDAVEVFRPAGDLCPDPGTGELVGELGDRLFDETLALAAAILEQAGDALVELGLEVAERQVFQLPLELPHAEAIGQGRVDVERLARKLRSLGCRGAREPAQRLRAARKAQQ